MSKNKNIYISLNVCNCGFHNGLPQPKKQLNDLGDFTSNFLNIYLPANSTFVSVMNDTLYTKKQSFYIPNVPTITLGVNYGVIAYLFKKAEGKSDKRAAGEATFEFIASWQGGNIGGYAGNVTKTLATRTTSRLGITMAGRILGGYVGSVIPIGGTIVGTIIGAVAGALIAGVVNDIIFAEENKALAEAKAENERIAKLQSQYQDKINQIASYLTNNHYIELRELTELEAEMLCKNLSNLDMDSKSGIDLMLSFPNYLKKESKQEVYSPTSPQGISFPYSSITYLTTIKALKDTLKEYLPKAKKIILYTPNPFVSLYTSSPFYIFNSNLSFFNPHLQYLLTSKDTQQWLYDTLFNLARDNREIIVYAWGGSIEDLQEKEELDFKESQANKKDLDSKDTNQSTNTQKQTKTYYLSPQGQKLKEKQPYCIRVIAKESKVFTILRDFITSFNTTKEQEVFRALEILLKDKESLEHLRQCIIKSLKEPIIESIYSLKETKDLNKEELKENVEEVFNNLLGVA